MNLGPAEILVILVVALLVFGPSRLPEIGRQVGRGVREFRKFQQTLRTDLDDVFSEDGEDMSDHAEPAPTLPARELEPPAPSGAEPAAASDPPEVSDPSEVSDSPVSSEPPPADPRASTG